MPRYNWDPDPARTVLFDLETQSPKSLPKVGTRAYLADPHTRLMSLVAMGPDRHMLVWVPPGRAPEVTFWPRDIWPAGFDIGPHTVDVYRGADLPGLLAYWIEAGYTFAAHNAMGFDAPAWSRLIGGPEPVFYDTLPCARAAGLPAGLDKLGKVLLGRGKDEGKEALRLLFTAKVKGGEVVYNVGTPPLWKRVLAYNIADVLLLERVFAEVADHGEADVLEVNAAINRRGVAFDRRLLHNLNALWVELQQGAAEKVGALTEGELGEFNIRSVPQVKRWLAGLGLHVDTLNRKELERLYDDPEAYFGEVPDGVDLSAVVEVLRQRQIATRISTGKIARILEAADEDGRIRDIFNYWGAHTGRWSGRGFQPHNLAKGAGKLDVEGVLARYEAAGKLTLEDVRDLAGGAALDDALSTLLRPVLWGAGELLNIIDYAAVEGRGVAWCAGEEGLLEMFASGADIYCDMASRIFGRPITKKDDAERQIGKITVLGSGYGMGAPKFALFCKLMRIDLQAAGTTAEACIDAYRDAYPKIAGERRGETQWRSGGLWKDYERAAQCIVMGRGPIAVKGRCVFYMKGDHLAIRLPSGRELIYRCARVENRVPAYAAILGLEVKPRPTLVYAHPHGYEGTLYGGLITENIVQAICRDLLATALVRCEAEGLPVVLHVHDEIVTQGGSLRRLAEIMSEPPPWAKGFPVEVEGFSAPRYVKKPFRGSEKVHARNGRVI